MVLDSADHIREALQRTPVEDVWGVGRQYAIKLKNMGITTAHQLSALPVDWARKHLGGVVGERLIRELNGEPCVPMKDPLEIKKMIATTRMFGRPVFELNDLREAVATYISRAAEKLRRQFCATSMIDVFAVSNGTPNEKYRYDPQTRHRQATLPRATSVTSELLQHAIPLVDKLYQPGLKYIKAGVILGALVPESAIQTNLFHEQKETQDKELMEALDNINFSMRGDVVKYVASGFARNWKMRQEMRSGRYTTRWEELFTVC
jgi:DNA polymerase V